MKVFFKKVLFTLYILTVTLILLEAGVRFWGYSESNIYDPIYMPFEKSENIPYVLKPNLKNARGHGSSIVNTDSLGLRSKTVGLQYGPKKKDEFRIAIAGDSVTFGAGVKRAEDTYCERLEYNLNHKQNVTRVKVFNFAFSGYSVKQMVATLRYRMMDVEPDLLIMAIIPDDFRLSRTPEVDKWGYFYQKALSGFISKSSFLKLMLRKVHLAYLLRNVRYELLELLKNNKLPDTTKDKLPESYKNVLQFKYLAKKSNLPYNIVLLPTASSFGILQKQLDQDKVPFVDLSSLYNEFSLEQYRASRYDRHPSAIVHKRISKILTDYIFKAYIQLITQQTAGN